MNIALILAGGKGTRMGMTGQLKQFIDIYGKPLIVHTLEAFDRHPKIDYIGVVCNREYQDDLKAWLRRYEINKVRWIVDEGSTRQESTYKGISAIEEVASDEDVILVHDAARPLVSFRIISENIEGAMAHGAVDTVIPSSDTVIKSTDSKTISSVPVRRELYLGQTPQSFRFSIIRNAHELSFGKDIKDATDDCQLVLMAGHEVQLVQGDKLNFKITTLEDLLFLKAIIKMGKLEMV